MLRWGRSVTILALVAVVVATAAVAAQAADGIRRTAEPIDGSYLVVFVDGVADPATEARSLAQAHGAAVTHVYRHALLGFAARMSETAALAMTRNPRVDYVEEDGLVRADTTQTGAPWGLDRIDQRDLPLNGTYVYEPTGSGVTAYVIDTGVRITHTQFGGRASNGTDTIDGDSIAQDCHGHGTHVAGTIGGTTYGVAKSVSLKAVRVLDCLGNGSTASVVGGVDWVTGHHTSGAAVANMSLTGGGNSAMDTAVRNSIADGVTYAVAAGNADFPFPAQDACGLSPARVSEALTVGATNRSDARPSWSNFGSCLDLFGPGDGIISAWSTSDTATNTISGTSMATPHVAGTAALYLQGSPTASPATVHAAIVSNATTGKVTSGGSGSPNRLLYMAFLNAGGGNNPPTASFTYGCTELACSFNGGGSSDTDGTIATYAWNFGDGATGSGVTASHTYASAGTFTVTLTVTDNGGATDQDQQSVTVSSGGGGFTLTATGRKVRGIQHADLLWNGASSTNVDVYRNGVLITMTANDGTHTDNIGKKGGGTYTYTVCEAGTSTCSNQAVVTF